MNILVTGGAGYIGSHCCQRLLADGHTVVSLDNLFRGHTAPMELLAGRFPGKLTFINADIADRDRVTAALKEHQINAVFHFGALAYVGESVDNPLQYYRANVAAGVALLDAIDRSGVDRMIFSSSCSTYGDPPEGFIPVPESCPQDPTSPYGRTKLMFEHMLTDYIEARRIAGRPFAATMLRYFNVAGSDRTGLLGEDHTPETHLIPVAIEAALGKRDSMAIFGTDYPTPDGTNIRDYVHVEDLIDAHVRALERLAPKAHALNAFNVGIGKGYSVREILDSVRRVSGVDFTIRETDRRAGDAIALYNDPTTINKELGWHAQITDIDEIVRTAFDWLKAHPDGYGD